MALYTTQVRTICQSILGYERQAPAIQAWDIVEKTWEDIFNPPFEIFDETYRKVLAKKILMHYYMREIAHETAAMWQLRLNIKMNEIMPYYNKLYKAYTLEFNPLYDTDYWTTRKGKRDEIKNEDAKLVRGETGSHTNTTEGTSNETGTTNNKDVTVNSTTGKTLIRNDESGEGWVYENDTPQGGINGLLNLNYLSKATKSTNTSNNSGSSDVTSTDNGSVTSNGGHTTTGNTTGTDTGSTKTDTTQTNNVKDTVNTTEDYVDHVAGKMGGKSFSEMLDEYRKNLINIDLLIIRELEPLFFGLW